MIEIANGLERASSACPPSAEVVGAAWYVVSVKLRRERFAATQLARHGVEVFLPCLRVLGPVAEVRPLFPGYLFARLVLARDWARVAWTPGVRRLVAFEAEAPPLPDDAVAFLRRQADTAGIIVARPRPLPVGCRVRLTDGPLAGLAGIIENPPDARGRVSILMDILRRRTRVSVDVTCLETD
jgi:transcriptional antiterminator RfaH